MRIRRTVFLPLGAVAIALSGCAPDALDDAPVAVADAADAPEMRSARAGPAGTTASRTSAPVSSPVPTPTRATVAEPPPAQPRSLTAPPVTAPTFVECLYGDDAWTNLALMSDGSWQWTAACRLKRDEQLGATPPRCPHTDQQAADPAQCETDPAPIPEEPWDIPVSGTSDNPLPDNPLLDKAEEIAWQKSWSACMAQKTSEQCRALEPQHE